MNNLLDIENMISALDQDTNLSTDSSLTAKHTNCIDHDTADAANGRLVVVN